MLSHFPGSFFTKFNPALFLGAFTLLPISIAYFWLWWFTGKILHQNQCCIISRSTREIWMLPVLSCKKDILSLWERWYVLCDLPKSARILLFIICLITSMFPSKQIRLCFKLFKFSFSFFKYSSDSNSSGSSSPIDPVHWRSGETTQQQTVFFHILAPKT